MERNGKGDFWEVASVQSGFAERERGNYEYYRKVTWFFECVLVVWICCQGRQQAKKRNIMKKFILVGLVVAATGSAQASELCPAMEWAPQQDGVRNVCVKTSFTSETYRVGRIQERQTVSNGSVEYELLKVSTYDANKGTWSKGGKWLPDASLVQ